MRAAHQIQVKTYDFVDARTHDGRALRMLTLIDEHTRKCLAIDVRRMLIREHVLERRHLHRDQPVAERNHVADAVIL